jgi:putative membrane protein insertion efficiency factor
VTPAPILWLRQLAIAPIRVYQRFISPLTPATCRFQPSCSGYARDSILCHGIFKGGLLATWRILRCNPLFPGGHEPVPPPGRWRSSE